jgi:hypothetical protein
MRTSAVGTRRWPRFPVNLPVHVVVRNEIEKVYAQHSSSATLNFSAKC